MRAPVALATWLVAGCVDATTPAWQLAYDRVVAVRAEPPHLAPGDTARFTALLAHADGPTSEAEPIGATASGAPAGLPFAVHYNRDHWEVNGPDDATLAEARAALGLPDGALVPLEISLQFPGALYAKKTVWLGAARDNPPLPRVTVDGVDAGAEVTLAADTAIVLAIDADPEHTVRWLTSCGTLGHDAAPVATLQARGACTGELAVVVRDAAGGVAWRVWPLDAP